jgi:uncharacterized repeat protein (TIGR01451 family)
MQGIWKAFVALSALFLLLTWSGASIAQTSDLSVSISDGISTLTVGSVNQYTITVTNNGPDDAIGASVLVSFPAQFTSVTSSRGAAASGNTITEIVNVPNGGLVILIVSGTVAPSTPAGTASFTVSVTVSAPSGTIDPQGFNDSASDTNNVAPSTNADLEVTLTDGVSAVTPGYQNVYTVTIFNLGPDDVVGATVTVSFPAAFTAVTSSGGGVLSGNTISETVSLVSGQSKIIMVTGTILPSTPPGTLSFTVSATVVAPPGVFDNNSLNDTAADTDNVDFVAPAILGLNPNAGPTTGGTTVIISGVGFTGTTSVTFGGIAATSFSIDSFTQITAVTPAHATGAVNVVVVTPSGSPALAAGFTYGLAATSVTLTSSVNPSEAGRPVTFTATVTGGSGAPSGTVTFTDSGIVLGTAALASGVATLTTSFQGVGQHAILATYGGGAGFANSTSQVLIQSVTTPRDSLRLRALQVLGSQLAAQVSGQAITGAIDNAIGEAFNGGGELITPSAGGIRINFAAESNADSARVANAFDAMRSRNGASAPAVAREWYGWVDIRGAVLRHFNSGAAALPPVALLYGNQVNALTGLTRKFAPDLLIGVLGGYETFDYRSDALLGRLKGNGWSIGSYAAWNPARTIRVDAAVTHSRIGYDGTAGTAAGRFTGERWLLSAGVTGAYNFAVIRIEPSLRAYLLREHEAAFVDTLGTLQVARDFTTGRISGGAKLSHPVQWSERIHLLPYVGAYGDYYLTSDSAGAAASIAAGLPAASAAAFQGWSARLVTGVAARIAGDAQIAIGAERSGFGSNFALWTYRVSAQVPFTAR